MNENLDTIGTELRMVGRTLGEVRASVDDLRESIGNDRDRLARLEERFLNHGAALERAFNTLSQIESRIKTLEVQAPIIKLVTGWVIAGVVAVTGMGVIQVWTVKQSADRPIVAVDREVIERLQPR